MPDIEKKTTHPEGQEPEDGAAQEPETSEETTQGQGAEEAGEESAESALWQGIAEDHPVRAEVANLRKEAAAKRTSAQQVKQENERLQDALKEAKTPEQVQELIAEWQGKLSLAESVATRERVGRRHALPDEVVELLKGDTEEKLDEHAQTLKGLFGLGKNISPPPAPPTGGKNPSEGPSDVAANLAAIKAGRR